MLDIEVSAKSVKIKYDIECRETTFTSCLRNFIKYIEHIFEIFQGIGTNKTLLLLYS